MENIGIIAPAGNIEDIEKTARKEVRKNEKIRIKEEKKADRQQKKEDRPAKKPLRDLFTKK